MPLFRPLSARCAEETAQTARQESRSTRDRVSLRNGRANSCLWPAPVFARKYPDIRLHIESGTTDDIIRHIEAGRINLGFIRPVENIGSLRFFSIAHERYLLAVAKESPLSLKSEIDIEDLRSEKIISFSRQNLSYSERYFAEKFEEHDLTDNVAYTCDDTFSLVSLVSAGLRHRLRCRNGRRICRTAGLN